MEVMNIHKEQIKLLTEFIIEKSLIFHPTISPEGCPDFSNHYGKEYILIIDRNIMTKIVEICNTGTLKDQHILKVISSLLFWAHFNQISITGGLALNEYANNKNNNTEASLENDIFLKMFDQYPIKAWLDLFEGKVTTIPQINIPTRKDYTFNVKNNHQEMHLAEILHIWYLLINQELSNTEKMIALLQWIDKNILFCQYSVVYAALLFSKQIKQPKLHELRDIDNILKNSSNQAWDLTYLSFWSTLYWDENEGNTIHLFATMDTDLKRIFINTHNVKDNLFIRCFGEKEGLRINEQYNKILGHRQKPKITEESINNLIASELNKLQTILSTYMVSN
ncbi:hypothetical protein ABH948_005229 [Bacillus sp. RC218]|uniref:hypothetical protein n=1 Tax=Bacillus sp. RC218 TaxID=3156282 RepID=UPI003835AAC2